MLPQPPLSKFDISAYNAIARVRKFDEVSKSENRARFPEEIKVSGGKCRRKVAETFFTSLNKYHVRVLKFSSFSKIVLYAASLRRHASKQSSWWKKGRYAPNRLDTRLNVCRERTLFIYYPLRKDARYARFASNDPQRRNSHKPSGGNSNATWLSEQFTLRCDLCIWFTSWRWCRGYIGCMQLQTIRKTGADAATFLQPEATRTGLQRFFVRGGGWDGYRMVKAQKWGRGEVVEWRKGQSWSW